MSGYRRIGQFLFDPITNAMAGYVDSKGVEQSGSVVVTGVADVPGLTSALSVKADLVSVGGSHFVPMALNGVPGGTADDTTAIMALYNAVPLHTTLIPAANATYSFQPDALQFNREGVTFGSLKQSHQLSGNGVRFKCLADGGFGVKFGDVSNYTGAGPKSSAGSMGIAWDFNGRKFTDAAFVADGLTKFIFRDNLILNVGQDVAGRGSKAMRLRTVWDSEMTNNFVHAAFNPGAPLIYFDSVNTDVNGNCNNLRFLDWQIEQISGKVFASAADSNFDRPSWINCKVEVGNSISIGDAANNMIWDLDNTTRAKIRYCSVNRALAAQWKAIARFGASAQSYFNSMKDNDFFACSVLEVMNGSGAAFTTVKDNEHVSPTAYMGGTNAAIYPWRFVPASDPNNNDFPHGGHTGIPGIREGAGWKSATVLSCPYGGSYVGDTTSTFPEQSVLRQNSALPAGNYVAFLPHESWVDSPAAVVFAFRVKRPSTGAVGALQIGVTSSSGTTVQSTALAASTAWQSVTVTIPAANLVGCTQMILQYGTSNAQYLDIDAWQDHT